MAVVPTGPVDIAINYEHRVTLSCVEFVICLIVSQAKEKLSGPNFRSNVVFETRKIIVNSANICVV